LKNRQFRVLVRNEIHHLVLVSGKPVVQIPDRLTFSAFPSNVVKGLAPLRYLSRFCSPL
jgi:hypothetical protein